MVLICVIEHNCVVSGTSIFLTNTAHVWLLSTVNVHVILQCAALFVALVTAITHVRCLTVVGGRLWCLSVAWSTFMGLLVA